MKQKYEISQTTIKKGLSMNHFPILSKKAFNLCKLDYFKMTGSDENRFIELSGFASAKEILDRYGPFSSDHIVVYAGPEENGKIGIATALFLAPHAEQVTIFMPSMTLDKSCDIDFKQTENLYSNIKFSNIPISGDIYIDALFGIELDKKPDRIFETAISELNQQTETIISIDVPSGVNADALTSAEEIVNPDLTLVISCLKPIHCSASAKAICGEIVCLDAGIPREFIEKYAEKQLLAC